MLPPAQGDLQVNTTMITLEGSNKKTKKKTFLGSRAPPKRTNDNNLVQIFIKVCMATGIRQPKLVKSTPQNLNYLPYGK